MTDLRPDSIIKRPKFLPIRRPSYNIDFHPRAHNKPLSCQVGLHHTPLKRILLNGIPHLYCIKCGQSVPEGVYNGTWSRNDLRKLMLLNQGRARIGRRTKKEIMEDALRRKRLQENKKLFRENMDKSIAKFVEDRFLDQ